MSLQNKIQWANRVSRADIRRLYESDARGLLDEELLERVLHGMHARITDMFEVREAQKTGRVKCRNCGEYVPELYRMGAPNRNALMRCATCGWQVTCGEFYASYNGKSLLPGSVTDIFEEFLRRFPEAHSTSEKLLLIDWLIHQFHVMQGVPRMPVGHNVIQGDIDQVRELIESLACGPDSTPGLSSPEEWRSIYYDPVRLFKQNHSHSQVQKIAAELGIQGRSKMTEDGLIPEILRLRPELAKAPQVPKEG